MNTMKHTLTALLGALALTLPAAAQDAHFVFRAQATTRHNTNLRAQPSLKAKVLLVVPRGQQVKVGDCTDWCQVTYQDGQQTHTGYLYAALLKRKVLPIITPQSSAKP
ncbi:SH3 domain-containing protein [Deinococcus psychrotolerans]|uniref:SH3 domain-containing protein n=2 Tax=Deinococcus psychrotolerans TaxID=2489213 RepID=A0A3G8YP00_9DEIO|nr:SH3 domain-containing protein [Deinococcus psychrotolerans]